MLVWETVKGVVAGSSGGDAVYFVTGNSEDFCDPDGELAAELVAECDAVAPQVRVVRFGDLEALMASRQLRPIVDTLTRSGEDLDSIFVRSSVQGGGAVPTDSVDDEGDEVPTISSVVREAVLGAAEELVNNEVALGYEESAFNDPLSSLVSSSVEGLSVSSIEPDESSFDWQTYETYDETTFLIRAEIVAKVSLLGFAHKSDAIDSDEFDVIDGDWNDHMSLVSVSARARLVFRIRVEQGQDFVEECELEEVEPIEESGGPS